MNPAPLLIYYGWPSCINGGHPEDFDRYAYVVLGAGLEEPDHPDHAITQRIIKDTSAWVYGYIDVGVTTNNYTVRRIRRSMKRWRRMGAVGVMLDDFGFGYRVTKQRQRRCIDAAHALGLSVICNIWNPLTDLDREAGLNVSDFLLCESYYIKEGLYDPPWLDRADQFHQIADHYGCGVMSVTTASPGSPFRPDLLAEAWHAAKGVGHVAFGWGEYLFSAQDSLAPWRERP